MKPQYESTKFETEAALCQAFLRGVAAPWNPYPETAGFDILLVHESGFQIGVEAKLSLNAKVIVQAIERERQGVGPDFRAVLVGKVVAENAVIARRLGLTVIAPKAVQIMPDWYGARYPKGPRIPEFTPSLPKAETLVRIGEWWSNWDGDDGANWFDRFPVHRCALPDYVPEVACGVPSPMMLSDWKIKAMRVCVWVERHGRIDRATFKKLGIDPSRWMNGHWLKAGAQRGEWVAGPHFPANQLRREHPNIFEQVINDFPKWSQKVAA
jgi:hypothetical protein